MKNPKIVQEAVFWYNKNMEEQNNNTSKGTKMVIAILVSVFITAIFVGGGVFILQQSRINQVAIKSAQQMQELQMKINELYKQLDDQKDIVTNSQNGFKSNDKKLCISSGGEYVGCPSNSLPNQGLCIPCVCPEGKGWSVSGKLCLTTSGPYSGSDEIETSNLQINDSQETEKISPDLKQMVEIWVEPDTELNVEIFFITKPTQEQIDILQNRNFVTIERWIGEEKEVAQVYVPASQIKIIAIYDFIDYIRSVELE